MGQVARHKAARAAAKRQAPVLMYRVRRREQALDRAALRLADFSAAAVIDAYVELQQRAHLHNVAVGAYGPGRTCVLH